MLEVGSVCILGDTGLVGLILFARKLEIVFGFLARACVGVVLIYGVNLLLEQWGYDTVVGLNLFTIACSSVLGVPGVVLLYACGGIMLWL